MAEPLVVYVLPGSTSLEELGLKHRVFKSEFRVRAAACMQSTPISGQFQEEISMQPS